MWRLVGLGPSKEKGERRPNRSLSNVNLTPSISNPNWLRFDSADRRRRPAVTHRSGAFSLPRSLSISFWPCDVGWLLGTPSRQRTSLISPPKSPSFLLSLPPSSAMAADAHSPTPKGVLCNAGAGAAAGTSSFLPPLSCLFNCLVPEK